ncbi:TetR/AcrR family transcriptional regulator [Methanobacterium ferruginis]|jgi:AcrR family transcriptional regulator|uniref:TetR/AcrR family transcriptional regulator n=1 Tax=Methanobacterium ferruginis TaxID=710191 RepID=UPI002573599D|nr:TetR/AcrR family transcriptional regulator [Methanobacterium ferruginis]MCC7550431.1 TetR/AcrR family transcriptional regulator [Methanobacterium sp.]BDZ67002.1 TetR family transcriptional regulator [Methanobacterium ferruginis]
MSTATRRKREREQRRQSIIDAAESLFFSRGYDNVSINDIAKEVELNRATIYLYFENKETLCFAVILRGVRILNSMVKTSANAASDTQKINAIGKSYNNFFILYPQYFQVYYYFQSGRFGFNPLSGLRRPAWDDVREIIRLQKEIFDMLHLAIKSGIKMGRISSNMNTFYATFLVMSTIDSMINPSPILTKELKDRNFTKAQQYFPQDFAHFVNELLKNKE